MFGTSARCFVVLACLLAGGGRARAEDLWLGPDKGLHFGASAVLAAGGYAGSMWIVREPFERAALGAGVGLAFGIGKELYDATGRGDPSWRDLAWDVIGCAFGVGVSLLLDHTFREPMTPQMRGRALSVIATW
jgi:putative lipoprotein